MAIMQNEYSDNGADNVLDYSDGELHFKVHLMISKTVTGSGC